MTHTAAHPRVAWLGDDFTGSAAVMEVLHFAGLPSVLFTEPPTGALLARFAGAAGVGLATTARAHGPDWMARTLPAQFALLDALRPALLHYKICSTFDSAPGTGSIGAAIEAALTVRPSAAVPLLTAAPAMRRYQAFGHLFAGAPEGVFRLDRHPVMAHHPATPMHEADLLAHLAGQTALPGALIDLEALAHDPQARLDAALAGGARILSIDSIDAASEAAAGRLIWDNRARMGLVAGSQGIEYALVRHWQDSGEIGPAPSPGSAGAVDRIAAVSGSLSPVTAAQLDWAGRNGFALLPFEARAACGSVADLAAEIARLSRLALDAARAGQSPLVHSAAGGQGDQVAGFRDALAASGLDPETANRRIGEALGDVLDRVLRGSGIRRAVISGGDTSGHAMRRLGLQALVAIAPTIPGAALCRGSGVGVHDGLEIALKGGQMGSPDYFGWIRDGGGPRKEAVRP
ncbi:four-carbon acid sugar kinase family protein [Paracoccus spongiarum]|uniref:Four-carbon acid sugar kinase family protein n=1 Tax=Paracoccus spongiarum TaxID=3064387 RepID=A0ABT9JBA0_9RHOB|nr:four-carbon acid sugar kinase family protein [Paracoccus sp. 2205BS29-5]MDP5307101.1 four-carbon acid sugar kinase family protein [Paracoccus sp. 2205BS29-5]